MAEVHQMEQARKKRQARKMRHRLLVFLLIVVGVLGGLYLMDRLSLADWDGLLTFGQQNSTKNFPLSLEGDQEVDLQSEGSRLYLLTNTNFTYFSADGTQKLQVKHGFLTPVMRTAGRFSLLYDSGGSNALLYRGTQRVKSETYSDSILTGDIASNGNFALVRTVNRYASQITLYNANYEELFTGYSSDHYLISATVHKSREEVLACGVGASGGVIQSRL